MSDPWPITIAARSDRGLKRPGNEDAFCTDPSLGLFVVCDGMGGHLAGEVASALTVHTIQHYLRNVAAGAPEPVEAPDDPTCLPPTNRLANAVRRANAVVHRQSHETPNARGMGTTVVAVMIVDHVASIAHVGDSRLYLIRGGQIRQLTADHSVVATQVRQGVLSEQDAQRAPNRHVLTRAVGLESVVDVDLCETPVVPGDRFLLCSDGLTRDLDDKDILDVIASAEDRQQAVDH